MTQAYSKITLLIIVLSFVAFTAFTGQPFEKKIELSLNEETDPKKSTKSADEQAYNNHVLNDSLEAIEQEFYYNIGTRYGAIKKSELLSATHIVDIYKTDYELELADIKSIELSRVNVGRWEGPKLGGSEATFNEPQRQFIEELDFSDDFVVITNLVHENELNQLIPEMIAPHYTVVPEVQAYYIPGKRNLLNYIRSENAALIKDLSQDDIGAAAIFFTITKNGELRDIEVDRENTLPAIQLNLINLLKNLPGQWEAARNADGEKVDQRLMLFFGNQGC
ncbi:MAG: hypothetical protein ACPGVV_09680 [Croceimicrobium sp.]